jgi:hypothetical protein
MRESLSGDAVLSVESCGTLYREMRESLAEDTAFAGRFPSMRGGWRYFGERRWTSLRLQIQFFFCVFIAYVYKYTIGFAVFIIPFCYFFWNYFY